MTASTQGRNDVGGALAETNTGLAIHGSRGDDGRVNYDGMNTNVFYGGAGGQQRVWHFNTIGVQETVIDTGGNNAESETGGANLNMVPREGGNRFSLHSILAYSTARLGLGRGVRRPDRARQRATTRKRCGRSTTTASASAGRSSGTGSGSTRPRGSGAARTPAANNYFNKSPVFYRYEAGPEPAGVHRLLAGRQRRPVHAAGLREAQNHVHPGGAARVQLLAGHQPRRAGRARVEHQLSGRFERSAPGQLALADELELPGDQPPPDPGERAVPASRRCTSRTARPSPARTISPSGS